MPLVVLIRLVPRYKISLGGGTPRMARPCSEEETA
jgi:hypothetical protein